MNDEIKREALLRVCVLSKKHVLSIIRLSMRALMSFESNSTSHVFSAIIRLFYLFSIANYSSPPTIYLNER
jgi:hypothetical protein